MNRLAITTPSAQRTTFFARGFHIDWVLLVSTVATVLTGIAMIHSVESGTSVRFLTRQMAAGVVGFMAMIFFMVLPYQIFRSYVRPLYIFLIVLLIAVLVPGIGTNLRGTRGWFHLGPVYLQSSELAKLLFVLTLAGYLDRRIEWYTVKSMVAPMVMALVPIAFIIIQPDFSSSLVFFPITLVLFFVAGARAIHLLSLCLVGGIAAVIPLASTYLNLLGDGLKGHAVLYFISRALRGGWPGVSLLVGVCLTIAFVWWFLRKMRMFIPGLYLTITITLLVLGSLGAVVGNKAIKDYQRKRLVAFVSPELDPLGGGYNVRQSQIAIGSGRMFGKGYGHGTQSQLGFLPSRLTDFIFSVIGEELGFFRAMVVLVFYFLIIWRGFDISLESRDRFGALVAAGFATMHGFYALLNLGMTMGLAPVAGVPLPMVSYGGSSVVSSMISIGILLSIHWRRYML